MCERHESVQDVFGAGQTLDAAVFKSWHARPYASLADSDGGHNDYYSMRYEADGQRFSGSPHLPPLSEIWSRISEKRYEI